MTRNLKTINLPEQPPAEPEQQARREIERQKPEGAFTQVPTYWLGRILDHGKPSIYGAWLYVFKLSKGPGFVLNETHVGRHHRIGRRAFRGGIKLLDAVGALKRHQPTGIRKSWAIEVLNPPPDGRSGYVRIQDRLLDEDADVLAFVAAVHISPTARRPIEIAKRIGIKSEKTARALQRRAFDLNAIEIQITSRDGLRVGWPGCFDANKQGHGKNVPTKDVTAKNVSTHSTMADAQDLTVSHHEVIQYVHTLSDESGVGRIDYLSLSDWKWAATITAIDNLGSPIGYATGADDWPLSRWQEWLGKFGGAPKHLGQPFAVKQAGEIAREAVSLFQGHNGASPSIQFDRAMIGIANALCAAARNGKTIRSLALVARPILQSCIAGDWDWANNYPSQKLGNGLANYRSWAEDKLIAIARANGHEVDADELLSTFRLEQLAGLFSLYGKATVEAGIKTTPSDPSDGTIVGWPYFETACKDIAAATPHSLSVLRPKLAKRKTGRA